MSSTQPRKRMLAERTHVRRRHETEETPKFRAKNRAEERFTSPYLTYERTKYPHLAMEDDETVLVSKSKLPSKAEREELSEKIARLLNSDLDHSLPCTGEEIADKETVFANLSEEDRREAVNAVSSLKSKEQDDPEARSPSKKGKVKANVMETGKDSIKQYMKSLSDHQVLSAHDEEVLGRQVQILTKWEEKRQELEASLSRPPTFTEWAEHVGTTVSGLKAQVRRSQKAKAAFVEANLRLVISIARRTVKKSRTDISFTEVCQEGIIGLNTACERFDPERGFRFSTYAGWWIRKFIHKSLTEQTQGDIRLPQNVMQEINQVRITEKILQDELGRKASEEEIADRAGLKVKRLAFLRKSLKSVQSLKNSNKDKKDEGKESNSLEDTGISPTDSLNQQMLKDDVRRLIRTLSPKEQAVIRLRFGLDDGSPATVKEIGKKFKVDDITIRKIEKRALTKLQQPYRNKSVKCY
eukprot:CAMPEP_0178907034 /NCGR_PEP_ID=MMETSP0786-20121207/7146_1 /TAXON_ID=186022 /ORGANISM="Thalassionema frauenfeldii, Strain CCMP 1798" /LENGTH=468 /DNA_ID=CAMNT_0020578787 /DNA_START=247 /DNA_END=1650 /DNA_ORIENTATION=-